MYDWNVHKCIFVHLANSNSSYCIQISWLLVVTWWAPRQLCFLFNLQSLPHFLHWRCVLLLKNVIFSVFSGNKSFPLLSPFSISVFKLPQIVCKLNLETIWIMAWGTINHFVAYGYPKSKMLKCMTHEINVFKIEMVEIGAGQRSIQKTVL